MPTRNVSSTGIERHASANAPDSDSGIHDQTPSALTVPCSVVMPVFNEGTIIDRVLRDVVRYAATRPELEFVFVDDGSADSTGALLEQAIPLTGCANVRLLRLPRNVGKGAAIREALAWTTAPMFMFMDGDLAYSMTHVEAMRRALLNDDVVIGSRDLVPKHERETSFGRFVMGKTFNLLARATLGLPYRDTQAGLKGMSREAALQIFPHLRHRGFAFDVELLWLAHRFGFTVGEIPAYVSPEHRSQRSNVSLVRDPMRMGAALVRIRTDAFLGRYRTHAAPTTETPMTRVRPSEVGAIARSTGQSA